MAEKHNIATDIFSFGQLESRNSSERERSMSGPAEWKAHLNSWYRHAFGFR